MGSIFVVTKALKCQHFWYYSVYSVHSSQSWICLPLHFVNVPFFFVCHSRRATVFNFHKHVSLLVTSTSLISLVCLTRLHVMRLAALHLYVKPWHFGGLWEAAMWWSMTCYHHANSSFIVASESRLHAFLSAVKASEVKHRQHVFVQYIGALPWSWLQQYPVILGVEGHQKFIFETLES